MFAKSDFYRNFAPKFRNLMKIAYRVAEHCFIVNINEKEELVRELVQYEPFRISVEEALHPVFVLDVVDPAEYPVSEPFIEDTLQDDDGSQIAAGRVGDKPCFRFLLKDRLSAQLFASPDYSHATVVLHYEHLFGLNNAMMVMYAMSTSDKLTALFHSSVISYQGKGYMFLGKSGTGKSTHSSLWLKYIENTELMNDDNPVVRIINGQPWVFGSPWSGKTPCYRNIKAPVGAIVQLSQAPYNKIHRIKGLKAYATLLPSISGMRWDKHQAEGLHETENKLAGSANVFHLECLPDEAAARLCMETVTTVE